MAQERRPAPVQPMPGSKPTPRRSMSGRMASRVPHLTQLRQEGVHVGAKRVGAPVASGLAGSESSPQATRIALADAIFPPAGSPGSSKVGSNECDFLFGSFSGGTGSGALSRPSPPRPGRVAGSSGDANERTWIFCADLDGDHRGAVPRALRAHRGLGESLGRTPPRGLPGANGDGLPAV